MFRPTSSDVPVARRRTTTAGRIARAVVATAVAGAALTGCTVAVEGVPRALPQTAPAPAPTTAPPVPTLPTRSDLDGEAAVYAEWVSNGWLPRPILPVTDPDSGASAWLFGTAERSDPVQGGIAYRSLEAPASVVNWFVVFPVPTGYAPDAEQGAANTASSKNGRVVSAQPVTVAGFPGLDVRIEFTDRRGRSGVDLIRYVELPQHLVGIESLGAASDERVLQQVHQIMVDKLTIPSV